MSNRFFVRIFTDEPMIDEGNSLSFDTYDQARDYANRLLDTYRDGSDLPSVTIYDRETRTYI